MHGSTVADLGTLVAAILVLTWLMGGFSAWRGARRGRGVVTVLMVMLAPGAFIIWVLATPFSWAFRNGQRTRAQDAYSKCPSCGYWAWNGRECLDCGFKR